LLAPLALAAFVSHGLLGEKSGPASADVSDRMTSAERSSEPTASPPVQTASALPLSPVASPDLDASASRLGSEAADGRTGLDANEASETTASSPPTAPPAVGEPPRTGLLASSDTVASPLDWSPFRSATAVRGVTDKEIRFGIAAPFTGPSRELGRQMKLGIETAFNIANDAGGVHGRQLKLISADDAYEPTRTVEAMKQLLETQQVFGFVGNVGTPTAAVALPYALQNRALFFGAFTGANLLRGVPPDRYVFNYRPSYAEETEAVVRYLVRVRGLRPNEIAVFAQQDAYGDSGFAGAAKVLRALQGGNPAPVLRLNYQRNSVDVTEAVARLRASKPPSLRSRPL
jgi:branched-chain amino acid transport system substrate-binding protein